MMKSQAPTKNQNLIKVLRWERPTPPTQEEAEARLHQEGYQSFCWYDVPRTAYPKHRHEYDECLWILNGQIQIIIGDEIHELKRGDRIYLSAHTPHKAQVPDSGVTYLVGQKSASEPTDT